MIGFLIGLALGLMFGMSAAVVVIECMRDDEGGGDQDK